MCLPAFKLAAFLKYFVFFAIQKQASLLLIDSILSGACIIKLFTAKINIVL